jgi:3-oxoacyl-ACP reductase-like protein
MGIFSSIRNAIFGRKEDHAAATQPANAGTAAPAAPRPAPQPEALEQVDVEQRLDAMPGADNLNWRSSIVDLLKLVGVESSYENREELAHELGNADYSGSAEDNILLHRQTMQALAKHGGKVPAEFLD